MIRIIYIILLFIGICSSLFCYSQEGVKKVIEIPWNTKNGCKTELYPDGRYGLSAFTMVGDSKVAILCDIERKIKIFNITTQKFEMAIDIVQPKRFRRLEYSNDLKMFYIHYRNKLYEYSISGFVKEYEIHNQIKFITKIETFNEDVYLITSDRLSYPIIKNGAPVKVESQISGKIDGNIIGKNIIAKINKEPVSKFELSINSKGKSNNYNIELDNELKNKYLSIIGGADKYLWLSKVTIESTNPIKAFEEILVYSRNDKSTIGITQLPKIHYTSVFNNKKVYGKVLYHLMTTPKCAVIHVIDLNSYSKSLEISFPSEFNYEYHYNNELQDFDEKIGRTDKNNEKNVDCGTNSRIMRSQILYKAYKYLNLTWTATNNNYFQGDPANAEQRKNIKDHYSLDKNYRVTSPQFSTTALNTSMPYKWGGWTHHNNWTEEVNSNKIIGDYQSDSDLTDCDCNTVDNSDHGCDHCFESEDTHVIGIDCSGLVCRSWNRRTKLGTADGEWGLSSVSTELTGTNNFSQLKRGDIINKPGHVRLVIDNNSGTNVNCIEAVPREVELETYNVVNDLSLYTPRTYDLKHSYDLHFKDFQIAEQELYQYGSLTVSITLENLGTANFSDKVRASIYNVLSDPNSDEYGEPLVQLGNEINVTVNANGTKMLTFSLDEIPQCVASGDYVILFEYEQTVACWPIIPREDFEGHEEITVNAYIPAEASFTYSPDIGEAPLDVQFTNTTEGDFDAWLWEIEEVGSDAVTYNVENPVHTLTNVLVANVSLWCYKNDRVEAQIIDKTIVIYKQVVAGFSADKTSGEKPLTVQFTNESSSNAEKFYWEFGDGSTSTMKSPEHTYDEAGSYSVKLTVEDSQGNSHTEEKSYYINVVNKEVSISGTVYDQSNPLSNVVISVDGYGEVFTNSNGKYEVFVEEGWSGSLVPYKDGFDFIPMQFSNVVSNETWDFYGNKIDEFRIVMDVEQPTPNTSIEFSAEGVPFNHRFYRWTIKRKGWTDNSPMITLIDMDGVDTDIIYSFECSYIMNMHYYIYLEVYDDYGYSKKTSINFEFGMCQFMTAQAYSECNPVRLGEPFELIDNSYPYENYQISLQVNWDHPGGVGETTYCTPFGNKIDMCNLQTKIGEDRKLSHWYQKEGKFIYNYRPWDKNNNHGDTKWGGVVVVDCERHITTNNFSTAITDDWAGVYQYFGGSFNIGNANIVGQNSRNVEIIACDEIVLKDGFTASPVSGKYLKILPDYSCLQPSSKGIETEDDHTTESEITDINKIENTSEILVYPNPNSGNFTIDYSKFNDKIELIQVFNSAGSLIQTKTPETLGRSNIEISNKTQGVYFVKLFTNAEVITRKVVVY